MLRLNPVSIFLVFSLSCVAAFAAGEGAAPAPDMKAADFEAWMTRSRDLGQPGRDPKAWGAALLARIDADRSVTDRTVLACLGAFTGFEGDASVKIGIQNYPATRTFIDAAVKRFPDRPVLIAELLRAKADILNNEGKYKEAKETFDSAAALYAKTGLTCDRGKIYCGVTSGDLSYVTKNNIDADARFLEVMSYPWYQVRDADALQELRDNYVRAVRGLIDVRRNDNKALEQIYVIPAVNGEVLPLIANAIKAAGGDPSNAENLKAMHWDGKFEAENRH